MRTAKLKKWVLSYKNKSANKRFVYSVKFCKYPERTKEYKKLKEFLNSGLIDNIGYCDVPYYQDNMNEFINWMYHNNKLLNN
jgi:hypothetical protein